MAGKSQSEATEKSASTDRVFLSPGFLGESGRKATILSLDNADIPVIGRGIGNRAQKLIFFSPNSEMSDLDTLNLAYI
jgi:hypothetical protein